MVLASQRRKAMRVALVFTVSLLLSAPQASAQAQALVIEGATLIDGTGRAQISNATIVIQGNRIEKVATGKVDVPDGARRINAKGKYVIPGLIDGHIHLRAFNPDGTVNEPLALSLLQGYLYSGVTTIYDAGNNPDFIFSLRDRQRSGEILSPRIYAAGPPITNPGGHGGADGLTVEDWAVDREKVDALLARQPDMIKITRDERGWGPRPMIDSMPLELVETIFRYVQEHGIRTTIHISSELHAWQVIYTGVDTLAHPVIQAPVSERYLSMMKVKKIPQSSTLTVGDNHVRLAEHPEFLDQPLYRALLDPKEIIRLKTEESKKEKEMLWAPWMKVMNPVAAENLKKVNDVGGIVALGTDRSLGAAVHRELELLVEGGISPADAIKIGTRNAAIYVGVEDELGTVEPGKLADLVILKGDPTKDINHSKLIDTVIKDGQVIDRGRLQIPANVGVTSSDAGR
jgi:imidazolonepropionase-like amidohydrolase